MYFPFLFLTHPLIIPPMHIRYFEHIGPSSPLSYPPLTEYLLPTASLCALTSFFSFPNFLWSKFN